MARETKDPGGVSTKGTDGGGSGGGHKCLNVGSVCDKFGAGAGRGEGGSDSADPELGVWSNRTHPG